MTDNSEMLSAMKQAVLDGDNEAAAKLAHESLGRGVAPLDAIERGYVAGIREAGDLWEEGEYFLPELVTAAEAMKAAMAILQPELQGATSSAHSGKVVIGTVAGDIHDIGKTLVPKQVYLESLMADAQGVASRRSTEPRFAHLKASVRVDRSPKGGCWWG